MPKTTMQRGARTLTHGQRVLLARLTTRASAWVRAGRRTDLDGVAAILGCILRLALLAAAAYGAWWLLRRWPNILWAAVPLWCWAAIRAIPEEAAVPKQADTDTDTGQETEEEGEEEEFTPAPEAPLPSPLDVCEAVWRVGTPHAHLAVLAEALDTTTDRVREVLAAKGIPVEPVRMKGRGSSTGVKASHFPTPATPSDGVVAAGQPANNNTNNVVVTRDHSGAQITVTPIRKDVNAA